MGKKSEHFAMLVDKEIEKIPVSIEDWKFRCMENCSTVTPAEKYFGKMVEHVTEMLYFLGADKVDVALSGNNAYEISFVAQDKPFARENHGNGNMQGISLIIGFEKERNSKTLPVYRPVIASSYNGITSGRKRNIEHWKSPISEIFDIEKSDKTARLGSFVDI